MSGANSPGEPPNAGAESAPRSAMHLSIAVASHGAIPDELRALSWRHAGPEARARAAASVEIVPAELHRVALDAPLVVVGAGTGARLHVLLRRLALRGPSGLAPYVPFLSASYPIVAGEETPEVVLDPEYVGEHRGRRFASPAGTWSDDARRLLDEVGRAMRGIVETRRAVHFLETTNCLRPLSDVPGTFRAIAGARIVDVRRARRMLGRKASSAHRVAPDLLRIVACAAFSYRLLGPASLLSIYVDADDADETRSVPPAERPQTPRLDVGWLDLDERLRL